MSTNKFQVRFLKIAEEDFADIVSFIEVDDVNAAEAIASRIERNLELLSKNPLLRRIPRDEEIRNLGYRYIIVQNYIIFYKVEEKTVFIHRILHGARNYKSLL